MTAPALDIRPAPTRERSPRWWSEVVLVAAFYAAYTAVRNRFGSAAVPAAEAYANARRILAVERAFGLDTEQALQRAALAGEPLVVAANAWYGTLHFLVPVAVLVLLHRRSPDRYRRWRNVLAATTALALVGFAAFPLMPPRLLCADCPFGGGVDHGYVDTLATHPGSWSFGDGGLAAVSNQYAAMPSLHLAWALWATVALWGLTRRAGSRVALVAYPTITLLVIVVTGNHYWLDAAGSVAVLAAGVWIGTRITEMGRRWRWSRPV